jgi:hypothetical protein
MSDEIAIYAAQLAGRIVAAEIALNAEARQSVRQHYEKQIKALRYELARVDPRNSILISEHDGIAPEPTPATVIRGKINHLAGIAQNSESPPHIQETAWRGVARLFAELEQITGEPAPYSEQDVEAHFTAKEAERRLTSPVPAFSHQANTSGAFQRRELPQETLLVSDPTQDAIAARRRLHQAQAQQHGISQLVAPPRHRTIGVHCKSAPMVSGPVYDPLSSPMAASRSSWPIWLTIKRPTPASRAMRPTTAGVA